MCAFFTRDSFFLCFTRLIELFGSNLTKKWLNIYEDEYLESLRGDLDKAIDSSKINTIELRCSWVNDKCKFFKQKLLEKKKQQNDDLERRRKELLKSLDSHRDELDEDDVHEDYNEYIYRIMWQIKVERRTFGKMKYEVHCIKDMECIETFDDKFK